MVAARKLVTDGLAHAVGQQQASIVAKHRIADRGVHADTGGASGEDQVPESFAAQDIVEFCLIKAAESRLVENNVFGLRPKLLDDFCVPRIANQESTTITGGCNARLTDAELEMANAVCGITGAEVRKIGAEAHLQVDDCDSRCAASGNGGLRWSDGPLDGRDVYSCPIEHPGG